MMKDLGCYLFVLLLLPMAGGPVMGDELAPPPVRSAIEQLSTFRFAESGYRIELVACEPMVQDPVVAKFDGEGRLWVVEMRGFMRDIDRNGVKEPIGRISVLQDEDGDGMMDRSTVFLDKLVLPRAISIHPDGVLVAENRPLWFVRDPDGDLVADERELIDPEYARDSVEHSANGLLRDLDNWIYSAKEGHRYRRQGGGWIRTETEKRGQWGICQDDWGRLYYNYNHSQLHVDLVPPGSLTRNPHHEPATGLSVGVMMTNAVFPIRPTPAANRGYIPGALDDRGRIREFTSACAPMVYRGHLMEEFRGNVFICEPVGNLIKRNVLRDEGLNLSGRPAYPDREFLASSDERFRPCWLSEGPDGAIYVTDMYRGIVQDGPHMSPYLRQHSIERSMDQPVHLGRIWRIVPEDFRPERVPAISSMPTDELVATLDHPSGWWRDRAQQFLVEGGRRECIPDLERMVLEHDSPRARLHALWTLEGLGYDTPERLIPSLYHSPDRVSAAVLRVLVEMDLPESRLLAEIEKLSHTDPSDGLILQVILSLGEPGFESEKRRDLIRGLLFPRLDDPLMRDAALSSLGGDEVEFLDLVLKTAGTGAVTEGVAFFVELLSQAIIRSENPEKVETLLSVMTADTQERFRDAIARGISLHGPGLSRQPIELQRRPAAVERHPELAGYFSWPGHRPTPLSSGKVRPLTAGEEALVARGRQVYLTSCVACHGSDGEGMKLLAPPLAGSDWVQGSEERLVRVLLHGLAGPIVVNGKRYAAPEIQPLMPPLANLDNESIAAVLTYIRREWGNAADPITKNEVSQMRIRAQGRTTPWTETELRAFDHAYPESDPQEIDP